jgi:hypothetical protein
MNKTIYLLIVSLLFSFDLLAYRSSVADTLIQTPLKKSEVQDRGSSVANLALTLGVLSVVGSTAGLLSLGDNSVTNAAILLAVGLVFSLLTMLIGIGGSWKYLKDARSVGLSENSEGRVRRKFGLSILVGLLGMTVMSLIVIALAQYY